MKEGWQIKTLGSICSFQRGLTYAKGDETNKSSKVVLRSNNVLLESNTLSLDEIKYLREDFIIPEDKKVRRNSILMCMSNGSKSHLGKVAIIDEDIDFAFGGFMGLLIPNEEQVFPRYLYYSLISPSYKLYINGLSDGANINNLKYADLQAFDIYLPSLSEQQRIVDVLDAEFAKIDALKANAEKNLQNAKDLFQASLAKELEPKDGWNKLALSSVSSESKNIKWNEIDDGKPFIYIDLTSVDRLTKRVTEPQQIFKSNAPSRAQRIVQADDIIFATTRPTLRRYCIISDEYDGQICSTGYCVIRPDKKKVMPAWLFYILSSENFYKYIEPLQTGATYPAVSDKDVRGYVATFPILEEQKAIIARLDNFNNRCKALQENYEKTVTLCDDLKQSLLKKAFNGEL